MKHQNFLANLKFITKKKCNTTKVLKTEVPDKIQSVAIQNESLKLNYHYIDIDKAFAN